APFYSPLTVSRRADHRDLCSFPTRRSSDLVAENDFMGGHKGLAENRFIDPMSFFQPNRVVEAGPVGVAFHATSFALRVSKRASIDRKSTRLNSSHVSISYAVFCLKKKKRSV